MISQPLLEPWQTRLDSDLLHITDLLVSELVAFSVRHQRDDARPTVRLDHDGTRLRVEAVRDDSRSSPAAEGGRPDDASLALVDELSDRWGVTRQGSETVCWLEIDCGL